SVFPSRSNAWPSRWRRIASSGWVRSSAGSAEEARPRAPADRSSQLLTFRVSPWSIFVHRVVLRARPPPLDVLHLLQFAVPVCSVLAVLVFGPPGPALRVVQECRVGTRRIVAHEMVPAARQSPDQVFSFQPPELVQVQPAGGIHVLGRQRPA